MRKIMLSECRRAVNFMWIPAVLGVGFSILFDSWNDLFRALSSNTGSVHYFFENSSLGGACRSYFLPIFTAFPFASSFCREYRDRAFSLIVYREGRKNYCRAKFIINALCGGGVAAAGTGLLFFFLSLCFPVVNPAYLEGPNAPYQNVVPTDLFHLWTAVYYPALYGFVEMAAAFLRGVLWANVALCVSAYFPDPFVTVLAPNLGSFLIVQMYRLLRVPDEYKVSNLMTGRMIVHSSFVTLVICGLAVLLCSCILWVLFEKRVGKRIKEELYG